MTIGEFLDTHPIWSCAIIMAMCYVFARAVEYTYGIGGE